MDAETIALKYPLKQNALFQGFTNEDGTVNIAFEHAPNKVSVRELSAIKRVFEQQFDQPEIEFRRSELRKVNGKDFIVIEMITPAADVNVYNLMAVTSMDGRLFISTFNCTVDNITMWSSTAHQVIESVKIVDTR